MDDKKLKIAHHECGHTVMALIFRQKIQKISLKGMDSPNGTDRYLGFTTLEPLELKNKFTVEDAIQKIMISLGGYASEILLYDGRVKIGGDDLATAAKWAEVIFQVAEIRDFAARLPIPPPGPLDMLIQNPMARAYIDYRIQESVKALAPFTPLVQSIAEKLCEREEIMGDEISSLFDSFIKTRLENTEINQNR